LVDQIISKVCMHCADLGNPAKPQDTMLKWTYSITEEFFRQGDNEKELGLPISPMMDRSKPNIEKSQVGFIDVIVGPLFRCFQTLVPETNVCVELLNKNKEYWLAQLKKAEHPSTPEIRPTIRMGSMANLNVNSNNVRSTTIPNPQPSPKVDSSSSSSSTTSSIVVSPGSHEPNRIDRSASIPRLELATPKSNAVTLNSNFDSIESKEDKKKNDSIGSTSTTSTTLPRGSTESSTSTSSTQPVVLVGLDSSGSLRALAKPVNPVTN